MYKLPVWNTIGEAYRFIWGARGAWVNYALGPILLLSFMRLLLTWLSFGSFDVDATGNASGTFQGVMSPGSNTGFALGFMIVNVAIYVSFAIAWHRHYLLGPEQTSAWELLSWKRRHWVFVGRAITFPATAIEDPKFGIRKGWQLAGNNSWAMVWVFVFGSIIPVFVFQMLLLLALGGLAFSFSSDAAVAPDIPFSVELVLNIVTTGVYFLGVAVSVSMLSIMYRRLRDNVPLDRKQAA